MEILRTPDDRFAGLPGYPFEPHYVDVDGVRIHYVDEGTGSTILLLHGEPSWSYLYRKMIPVLVGTGHRCVAPDLVGFGRSDKPSRVEDYTFARHVAWIHGFIEAVGLKEITLFGQDWGSLIGLRLAAENGDRFARVAIGNGGLPTGDADMPEVWHMFKKHVLEVPELKIGSLVASGCVTTLAPETKAAYDAPFPAESLKAGARAFPRLVPTRPDDPAAGANRAAWAALSTWEKPFLTLFSDSDPITRGADVMMQKIVPGAAGQPHATIEGAGHFLQEDRGEVVAEKLAEWLG
ncbi:MAG: haloalkane dehalogenase [Actinomycetota bacterium]|nr:haloalkane dehalogenase [Actinomycetota bacterium]